MYGLIQWVIHISFQRLASSLCTGKGIINGEDCGDDWCVALILLAPSCVKPEMTMMKEKHEVTRMKEKPQVTRKKEKKRYFLRFPMMPIAGPSSVPGRRVPRRYCMALRSLRLPPLFTVRLELLASYRRTRASVTPCRREQRPHGRFPFGGEQKASDAERTVVGGKQTAGWRPVT